MATYGTGAAVQVVIGKEPSYATADPTPVGHKLRVQSANGWDSLKQRIRSQVLTGNVNPTADDTGLQVVPTASLVMPVDTEEFAIMCYFFLGSYAVSGSAGSGYTHTFKTHNTTLPPSAWIEIGDTTLDKFDMFYGCVPISLSFGRIVKNQASHLMATWTFSCSGFYERNNDDDEDSSPDTYSTAHHSMPKVAFKVDGAATALITEVNYTISRNVQLCHFLNGTLYADDVVYNRYDFDFTVAGYRDSSDTLKGYDDDAEHTFEIVSERPGDATRYVSIDHDECYALSTEQGGAISEQGPQMVRMRVAPFYDDVAAASSITVTIVNDTADISAIF